jgi:large subunit ribosomal protein L19
VVVVKELNMGRNAFIEAVEQDSLKKDLPSFRVGDTLKVNIRVVEEGGKERIQSFTGTCIARKGGGLSETISLHRIAYGEGMEKVIFLHSPLVSSIEVIRTGDVRRGKLYYLRGTSGKASKVKSRFDVTKAEKVVLPQEIVQE